MATTTKSNTPTETDLQGAVNALHGIFWALEMLVVHKVADDIAHKDARDSAVDELIIAGELITDELSARF